MALGMLVMHDTMPKVTPKTQVSSTEAAQPIRVGFKPLTDCAPLLVAKDKELFRKHGVRVELSCEVGWATIREKLLYGQLDAAHAIAGLALAMRLGLSCQSCRVVAPFVFNLHGNAITLSRDLWDLGVRDAVSLKKLIRNTPTRRFTFSTVSKFSSHYFVLRQWLASGGIDVNQDVRIVVLPPTQIVGNLQAGLIDGGCVGEPYNSSAVVSGAGWIAATSEQLAPNHPEKVFLTTEALIAKRSDQVTAIINALKEACAFCDQPENRPEVAGILIRSGFFHHQNEDILRRSLCGPLELGCGRVVDSSTFYIFHRRDANEPTWQRGRWLMEQFVEHGLITPAERAEAARALAECWTSNVLPLSPKSAAAKTARNQNKNKNLI